MLSKPLGNWRIAGLFLLIVIVSYPLFFTLGAFPWYQGAGELHDAGPTPGTLIPNYRAFRYELFHHGNLLWTNLRAAGVPVIGEGIQAAPLFPITLLLSFLPENIFIHYSTILRLVLIGLGCFLFARDVLKFRSLGSFIFSMTFGYSLYVMKWMNHPWQSGLLATVWYWYFFGRAAQIDSSTSRRQEIKITLGLILAVYAVVTCGFPEAAGMTAVMTFLIFTPRLIELIRGKRPLGKMFFALLTGHLLGLCLSSAQILALMDLVNNSPTDFRAEHGLNQFPSAKFLLYELIPVGFKPTLVGVNHFFGLIGATLFLMGITSSVRNRRLSPFAIGGILCALLYFLKSFPYWPAFNQALASLPLLKQTFFPLYFFSCLLFPFAYFAGVGADLLPSRTNTKNLVVSTAIVGGWLIYVVSAAHLTGEIKTGKIVTLTAFWVIALFFLFRGKAAWPTAILMVAEFLSIRPAFLQPAHYFSTQNARAPRLAQLLREKHIDRLSTRESGSHANFLSAGIASWDGDFAIIPARLRSFRRKMFIPSPVYLSELYAMPEPRVPYALQLTSTSLHVDPKSPLSHWQRLGNIGEGRDGEVYYDDRALSRAYLPSRCTQVKGGDQSLALVSDVKRFQFGEVVVEDLATQDETLCQNHRRVIAPVAIESDTGSEVRLAKVEGPTIVVLNDNFYPEWVAFDRASNLAFPIYPANHAFRAVMLPEKRSYEITFHYRPRWARWALLGFGLGLLGVAILIWQWVTLNHRTKLLK